MSSHRRSSLSRVCGGMAVFALSVLLSLALASCGDDDSSPTDPGPEPTNHAPAEPAIDPAGGLTDGATDMPHALTLRWTCSDPDGDTLTYDVYFGTAADPPLAASSHTVNNYAATSLSASTEYFWKVVAEDPDGEATSSPVWSFTTAAATVETVSQPSTPTGPATGQTGEDLTFTASGSVSSLNVAVQYRFDWGDGNTSDWSASTRGSISALHSWATAGSYDVKVQARSTRNTAITSDWSAALAVAIQAPPETITISTNISGPDNLAAGVVGDFTISGFVTSSEGHETEWRFVWGDGTYSDWITVKEGSHTYAAEGTYDLGLQGRCIQHPTATHERTRLHTIEIAAAETITAPGRVDGISGRNYSQFEYWLLAHATSSFGHDIELRYDFGDGEISDWVPEWTYVYHTWNLGTYNVVAQARCAEHTEIVSEWGTVRYADFAELLSGSNLDVTGPLTGSVGEILNYSVDPVESNEGHPVEYTIFYRRANTTEWIEHGYEPTPELTMTWDSAGTYYVKARARCALHPELRIASRDFITVVISP